MSGETGHDGGQPERFAELVVLGAGARCDVDDARPLVLADFVPRHDPVLVVSVPERLPGGGEVVERALVTPADELAAGFLLLDQELADDWSTPRPTQNASSPCRIRM